jgi:hypothetical protein
MNNIPAASGSPVRRSDLSEHVLYDLDAYAYDSCADGPECEYDGVDEDPLSDEEVARLVAEGPF